MTDDDDDDLPMPPEPYSCIFCSEPIENEQAAVALTATWMPHWRAGRFSPLAQDFWAHSVCLQKNWKGAWPWEEQVLFGADKGDELDYVETLGLSVARPEDRESIEETLGFAFEEGLSHAYGSDLIDQIMPFLTHIEPTLLISGTYYVLADMDGQIAACGGYSFSAPGTDKPTPGTAHIRNFATHPDYAGYGLGRRLFDHCLKEARAAGAHEFVCYSGLNAEGFYQTLGFERESSIEIHIGTANSGVAVVMPAVMMRYRLPDHAEFKPVSEDGAQ